MIRIMWKENPLRPEGPAVQALPGDFTIVQSFSRGMYDYEKSVISFNHGGHIVHYYVPDFMTDTSIGCAGYAASLRPREDIRIAGLRCGMLSVLRHSHSSAEHL